MRYNTKGKLLTENSFYFKKPDTYYEASYVCSDCSYNFSVVSEKKPVGRCPGCPKCKEENRVKKQNLTTTHGILKTNKQIRARAKKYNDAPTAPKQHGRSGLYKAHDATMQMVMEDYGYTDINDRPNEGENCVPKLPPHLEKQVNEGFGASFGDVPKLGGNIDPAKISSVGMASINSGRFRDQTDVVAMQQNYGPKPKFNFINE